MVPRYSRPDMTAIWSSENRYRIWFAIEVFAAVAMGKVGMIPAEDAAKIRAAYDRDVLGEIDVAADKEAATIVERARHEAETIVSQAKESAEALVERRQRMAEDKIAAEERHAIEQLRATAAEAAREAAARLIRDRVDEKADEALVGDAIRSIGSR